MPEKDKLYLVPLSEIRRIRNNSRFLDPFSRAEMLAQVLRINILYMIKNAGSGHIGTSFSAIDIMTWLWLYGMNTPNTNSPNADMFFSSKGHDVPALYAGLTALEYLPFDQIHQLRRLNGLPGHPDIHTPYIATNTGPLGMGISKAKGMAIANRLNNSKGRVFVLTGDGELQEGQFWESLQGAVNLKLGNIVAIVDHNKIQSDTWVEETSSLGKIEEKIKSFGWFVQSIDGHNFSEIAESLNLCLVEKDVPKMIIANTTKGRGVSFMEEMWKDGLYKFHSGAPSDEDYYKALEELLEKTNILLVTAGIAPAELEPADKPVSKPVSAQAENLIRAYGQELVYIGDQRKDVIVLDADLVKDTGLLPFKNKFPDRFVECGIAEQDMVSTAGGLALRDKLPIVHSFECFLSTRANEQLYNNATEKTKIIYVGSLAGILPAGPGHSHQSVRGISALGSIPGLVMIQPCNELETKMALNWAVYNNPESTYIRLVTIPVETNYSLPASYTNHLLIPGQGVRVWKSKTNSITVATVAYGPVMLREAVKATQILETDVSNFIQADVFNFPWLNRVDTTWALETLGQYDLIVIVDDHYKLLGLGNIIATVFGINRVPNKDSNPKMLLLGLEEIPACGQNNEVLKYHSLNAESIAEKIGKII